VASERRKRPAAPAFVPRPAGYSGTPLRELALPLGLVGVKVCAVE
jgi:hypothetical protein